MGIEAFVDSTSDVDWGDLLSQFSDANLYQTVAYAAVRWGVNRTSHIVVRDGRTVVGMARLALAGAHRHRAGIAYLRWGPVWRRTGEAVDAGRLITVIRAIVQEYVVRRGLSLRVVPNACKGTLEGRAYEEGLAGFRTERFAVGESYRTLTVDLTPPLDVIRRRLEQKWRNLLNKAERQSLIIREGADAGTFARYAEVHQDMVARKKFVGGADVEAFERMQSLLPDEQKLHVMIAEHNGINVSGLVGATMGDTGIYLLGATTTAGMQSQGAYALQWKMIQHLKAKGARLYDLNGINPETNPGVYRFKSGLGGVDRLYMEPCTMDGSMASSVVNRLERRLSGAVRQRLKALLQSAGRSP